MAPLQSPLEALLSWYDQQPPEIRTDIAFSMGMMLFDTPPDHDADHQIAVFRAWLDEGNMHRAAGKTLSFIVCFENFYSSRFTDEGWRQPAAFYRDILKDESDQSHFKASVETMLAELPDRAETWCATGRSWNVLKERVLTSVILRAWPFI